MGSLQGGEGCTGKGSGHPRSHRWDLHIIALRIYFAFSDVSGGGEIISADVHSDNVTDMYGNIVVLSCGRCCCLWDAH